MSLISWAKKEFSRFTINNKPKKLLLPPPPVNNESSVKCLHIMPMPMVNEVVIGADLQCAKCQMRVADVISKMDGVESVMVHVLDKRVTLTLAKQTD